LVASSLVYTPNRQTWLRYVGICLMFALAILVRVTVHYYGSKPGNGLLRTILQDIDVGLIAAGLISYAAIKQASLLTRALSWAPLAFIGTFAYSIYLIHLPLLQCEWLLLRGFRISDELAFGIGCIVGIPVIVGLSYGFHCLFERPFLRRKVVICQTKS